MLVHIRVSWVQVHHLEPSNSATAALANDMNTPTPPPSPVPPDPLLEQLTSPSLLKQRTRALILPRTYPLHRNLARMEEVSPSRLRVGVAFTSVVSHQWRHSNLPVADRCPHYDAPISETDVRHLLSTCPATYAVRIWFLGEAGLRWT